MSISQQQYYEAKVFLTQLADAHRVLDEGAKQKATVSKLKSFEGHLIYGVSKGQVKIVDGGLVRGNSFDSHRLKDISIFSNNFFTKNLANFANAKNAEQLASLLKNAAK